MHTGSIGVDGHHFKGGSLTLRGRAPGRAGMGRILGFWPFAAGHSLARPGRASN